ncbi:MAG: DnaJ C-terminal domain-containing protein [Nocardioides sp.]
MSAQDGFRAEWASKDFYRELAVAKDATQDAIKKSYRKLARENHPDSNPGESPAAKAKQEKFKAVAEAYDVVGDPEKRKKYDEMRAMIGSGGSFPGGFGGSGGFDLSDLLRQRGGGGGFGGPGGGFGDVLGDMFGARGRTQQARRPQKGADTEATATISFVDALAGVTISLRLASEAACLTCQGTGGKPGTKPQICPECEGAGFIVASAGGGFSLNETCPACLGRQLLYAEACGTCRGSGRGTSSRAIQARIPAGVKDGQRIRLRGKGSLGTNGGPAGDLFVSVKVTPHRLFGRKLDNLTLDVPISFDEAALGAAVKVPTLAGSPVTLRIPAGTPNGRTFRVRGKGARRSDGSYGDLLATVQVQVPAMLDGTARQAIEAYRAAMADKPLRANLFEV